VSAASYLLWLQNICRVCLELWHFSWQQETKRQRKSIHYAVDQQFSCFQISWGTLCGSVTQAISWDFFRPWTLCTQPVNGIRIGNLDAIKKVNNHNWCAPESCARQWKIYWESIGLFFLTQANGWNSIWFFCKNNGEILLILWPNHLHMVSIAWCIRKRQHLPSAARERGRV